MLATYVISIINEILVGYFHRVFLEQLSSRQAACSTIVKKSSISTTKVPKVSFYRECVLGCFPSCSMGSCVLSFHNDAWLLLEKEQDWTASFYPTYFSRREDLSSSVLCGLPTPSWDCYSVTYVHRYIILTVSDFLRGEENLQKSHFE